MAFLLSRRELLVLAAGAAAGGCLFPHEDAALARAKVEALAQMEKGFFTGAAFARSDRGDAGYVGCQGRGSETGAVDARTLFDAASLTKTIVAAVLALQVVEGRLDPDAPFIRYLPDHAAGKDCSVTIRQLATHTGGFGHVLAPARPSDPTKCLTDRPFEERLLAQKPARAPGHCMYSCYNFQLLALIAERVGGKPIDVLAREMLFRPLGMDHSRWWPVEDDGHVMHPEVMPPANFVVRKVGCVSDPPAYHARRPTGNAGLFTTLGDLRLFTADLLHRSHFPRAYYDLLFTCTHEEGVYRRSFGFNMSEPARVPGLSPRTIHHSGYTGQSICVDPETGFAGVVLTVRSAGEGTFMGRLRILSLLNGDLEARPAWS